MGFLRTELLAYFFSCIIYRPGLGIAERNFGPISVIIPNMNQIHKILWKVTQLYSKCFRRHPGWCISELKRSQFLQKGVTFYRIIYMYRFVIFNKKKQKTKKKKKHIPRSVCILKTQYTQINPHSITKS